MAGPRGTRARRLPRSAGGACRPAASTASMVRSPISACRRCSSMRRDAASVSVGTNRSTCAWIKRTGPTAAQLVAEADEVDLADVIFRYGEERFSRRIARAHRRGPARRADCHDRPAGRHRPSRDSAQGLPAHRSGDPHVSGAANLGQSRAGRSRRVSRRCVAPAAAPARGSRSSPFIRSRIGSSSTPSGRWRPVKKRCAC